MSSSDFILTDEALSGALPQTAMATKAIHADDFYSPHRAIAPGIHVAVNYRYARDPDNLVPMENDDPNAPNDSHVYSRYTTPNSNRFETVLRSLFKAECVSYSTGISAFHAMMLLLNPKRIFMTDGYHGAEPGDVIHVETPLNPTGESRNLAYYKSEATAVGAYLTVDSTFAPPPLQDPIQLGAGVVLHSGTKYLGGHSDMLCGILVVHPERSKEGWTKTLYHDRQYIGSVMGTLEAWLGIRSLRTLQLRVTRQSENALALVQWLSQETQRDGSLVSEMVEKIHHSSLQHDALEDGWLQKQMPGGFGPVFSIIMKDARHAKSLPSRLFVFQHATSLGGVESLMEWRPMSDKHSDSRLMRVSCGIEEVEDLKADIVQAFEGLWQDFPSE
ncbi:hypothetical protein FDECE_649 [Fusarium decemcellulare]|nr:hypothetical protein FDECE_649 [Fusarium decemcellulare]